MANMHTTEPVAVLGATLADAKEFASAHPELDEVVLLSPAAIMRLSTARCASWVLTPRLTSLTGAKAEQARKAAATLMWRSKKMKASTSM